MSATRLPLPDALKAIASQLIVLHHLSAYGTLATVFALTAPDLAAFCFDYGRMAVQVFLVCGGFLAAKQLAPEGVLRSSSWHTLMLRRYARLTLPYAYALLLAILAAALARTRGGEDWMPGTPHFGDVLAHLLLVQGVLEMDSLSAGVWYVAIDFQLFAGFATLLCLTRYARLPDWAGPTLVLAGCIVSLFVFNRNADWDNWAVYFFASYALGALAWWCGATHVPRRAWVAVVLLTVLALWLDFRLRIGLGLAVAALLQAGRRLGFLARWPQTLVWQWLSDHAYSIFLVHFPVCLLANALASQLNLSPGMPALCFFAATWLTCLLAGAVFQRVLVRLSRSRQAAYPVVLGLLGFAAA